MLHVTIRIVFYFHFYAIFLIFICVVFGIYFYRRWGAMEDLYPTVTVFREFIN